MALLRVSAGLGDHALMISTGMRRGELAGLRIEDLDLDHDVCYVTGKGSRARQCPFGHKSGAGLRALPP